MPNYPKQKAHNLARIRDNQRKLDVNPFFQYPLALVVMGHAQMNAFSSQERGPFQEDNSLNNQVPGKWH